MNNYNLNSILRVSCLFFSSMVLAQLTTNEKNEVIMNIGKILDERYVIPETAETIKNNLMKNYRMGKYDTISEGNELAFQLTKDLQLTSKDFHVNLNFSEEEISIQGMPSERDIKEQQEWLDNKLKENNYGVKKLKILQGNVGYIEIPLFGPLDQTADTLVAAMQKIENTDALILDLRGCMGSLEQNSVPFFASFFFKESVHLFDFYVRPTDTTKQFWTYLWLPYKKYLDKPVYILTSPCTFSGSEEIAYDFKQLKRAILVGETSRGGANPTERVVINKHFDMALPYMRSINPITKTNWEGTGVVPDTSVKSYLALQTAHLLALDTILTATTDVEQKKMLDNEIQKLKAYRPELRKVQFVLEGFDEAKDVAVSGSFNYWDTDLFMTKKGNKWVVETEFEPGTISYRFIVDGRWITDPGNPNNTDASEPPNSVLVVD
ncbi:MAG: hypothetical protein HKN31_11885 [Pricia sp.]|nr:hypothetical protein [Pricia sp.]